MSTTHEIRLDRRRPLREEAHTGHNRWHPEIPPILTVHPGDTVIMDVRDGADGMVTPDTQDGDLPRMSLDRVHPLTGPIYVKGAQRGDVLEVKILDVTTQTFGFTTITPGFGLLRECFPRPFVIKWEIDTCKNVAASPRLPGIQIPGAPFMGVMGTAPSHALMQRIASREKELLQRGGFVLTPSAKEAVPANEPIASEALRTIPPRENGGNLDVKQLTAGTTLLLPVFVPGALFSAGDGHCAQGDAESCGTAVETGTTLTLELNVREGKAGEGRIYGPQYERNHSRALPRPMPERYHATTGISVTADGRNESENVTLAARNAVLSMIDYLVSEHGLGREQAYALASVAVDLRISTIVGVPNVVVSAFLPLDIFC